MIRKSGHRFSEKIMLKQKDRAFSSEPDTGSFGESASEQESRDSVLIQSELKLWAPDDGDF
jgi:hypothetical protein